MILLLTAVVAIFLATLRAVVGDRDRPEESLVAMGAIGCPLTGLLIGAFAGAGQRRPVVGILIGAGTGVLVGISGIAFLAKSISFIGLAIGSVLVLSFAGLVRFFSRQRREPE